jgi:hypothetical protein
VCQAGTPTMCGTALACAKNSRCPAP